MERYRKMWKAVEKEHGELSQRELFTTLTALTWADKTMIEKVYDWIINNMPKYVKANQLDVFINNLDMASDLRKAMEE